MPLDDLTGQVALVTGGGRGIGAGIARELASAGARVAVAARTREQIEQVAHEIEGVAIEVDVTDAAAVERMVNQTESELGPIDILVANAGTGNRSEVWEGEPDDWWRTFEVNVLGVYLSARAVIPGMLERGRGRMIVTGSGAGYLPGARNTDYTSSKAAVNRFAETLAESLQDTAVRVFLISPGLVQTAMTSRPLLRRCALDATRARAASRRGCSPRAVPTSSRAATSTPSTTTSRISSAARQRSARTT